MKKHALPQEYPAALKVMGVGGGGNAVRHLLQTTELEGVDMIGVNTDTQALEAFPQRVALPIGAGTTGGLGAGSDPEAAIRELEHHVDSLVVVQNDRLLPTLGADASMMTAFAAVNEVLREAVSGITETITRPGLINVDFADVASVLRFPGRACIGSGEGHGENRVCDAVQAAVTHPLLEATDLSRAPGLLVSIAAGPDVSLSDLDEIGRRVGDFTGEDTLVVLGTTLDKSLEGRLRVTLLATGLQTSQALPGNAMNATPDGEEAVIPSGCELLSIPEFLEGLRESP